ncbi:MAG: cob(I)yrinic acid a,c-diamide adenosyltransferase [Flavobacteriaceae bacterium]|nr:cob(I)yrinic acid a,c-diamide adenosyltransferase [Flavobacteriaceae bacterium]
MKIYTKTGDKGTTGLYGGTRVAKHNIRIEAYGTIDELNSYIGLIKDLINDDKISDILLRIQNELFTMGAMLATPESSKTMRNGKERLNIEKVETDNVLFLEQTIDDMDKKLKPMTSFVLPGGHPTISHIHIARCICRRAERIIVRLSEEENIEKEILKYTNRLSDLLFVLSRFMSFSLKIDEIPWIPKK